jgi:hypothetical protein
MDRDRTGAPGNQSPVISIELCLDGSMPAGVATGPDGAARDFTGWVGLMAAVDALAEGEANKRTEDGLPWEPDGTPQP